MLPELLRRHRVLAVDLPGHAGSAPLPRGATIDDFAAAAAAALEAEGVESALVAGHSFGGLVALRLAHGRPDLVRGLLLVAPAGIATRSRILEATVIAATTIRPGRAVARSASLGRPVWYRRALFRPWFVADADALTPRATHGLLAAQDRHTDTKVAGRAMIADDPRQDLAGVTCRVLVLWGGRDAQLPLADAFEYARRLRAAPDRRRLRPSRDRRAPARGRRRPGGDRRVITLRPLRDETSTQPGTRRIGPSTRTAWSRTRACRARMRTPRSSVMSRACSPTGSRHPGR